MNIHLNSVSTAASKKLL